MKALQLLLAISVTVNLGYSQNETDDFFAINANAPSAIVEEPTAKSLNQTYLDKVIDHSMAIQVSALEKRVSEFDITSAPGYKKGKSNPFKTVFKTDNAFVEVSYDKEGKIINTVEKYKAVKLPMAVRDRIFKAHPEWTLLNVDYTVNYDYGKVKRIYQVKIGKGKSKKRIKVNADGRML